MNFILEAFLIAIGLNVLLFVPAYLWQSDKLTDISYALTFIVLAAVGYLHSDRQLIHLLALWLVVAWAIRIGIFLFYRVLKFKKDSRFDDMRGKWLAFLRFWFLQGLTVFIILLPGLFLWDNSYEPNIIMIAGILIWGLGLIIETVADYQKIQFKLAGRKSWIDQGIWRASRHPNYLGEITVWIGFYLSVVSALPGNYKWIALASPLYIAALLLKGSGVPILEKAADQQWGKDKKYQEYKKSVPVLVPTFKSLGRLFK